MRNYRYENKYIIDQYTYQLLSKQLKSLMKLDEHSLNDEVSYEIRSLYYDNFDNDAYYEKVNGIEFRKKYRLRMYNNDQSTIKLECKYKDENMTSKDTCRVNTKNGKLFIKQDYQNIRLNNPLYKQFISDIKLYNLKPKVIVDYRRLAFVYPISDVRITFDCKLKSSGLIDDYFEPQLTRVYCFDENQVVLEVKYKEFLPEILQMILNQYNLRSVAISKFATSVDYL